MDTTAIVRASRRGPACRASIVCPAGMSRPPPTPCSTRKAIRLPADQAAPHSAEPAMNRTSEVIQTVLAPKRCTAQPVTGIVMDSARRYPVNTHWIVLSDVSSSRPSTCTATLTIVVSITVMIAPSTTTTHMFRSAGSKRSGACVVVIPASVRVCPPLRRTAYRKVVRRSDLRYAVP